MLESIKNYSGPEILSSIRKNKRNITILSQKVDVKCVKCGIIKNVNFYNHAKNILKRYPQASEYLYKCSYCTHSEHFRVRNKQNAGKTLEEIYGKEKAIQLKKQRSEFNKNNPWRYKALNLCNTFFKKNKTYEEIYGTEKSILIKSKQSKSGKGKHSMLIGPKNPQYGKPAHKLSGKSCKGYYKNIFFRSIHELSFIINVLEKNNIAWESGELKKHIIPYVTKHGIMRNYFPDFITEKEIIEIKPAALINTEQNISKQQAAKIFAKQINKEYKIYTERDFDLLKQEQINTMLATNILKFIKK
jgi:hypothetical protein